MNAVLKPVEDGQLIYLSPNEINVVKGFNPRTFFDETSLNELADSIRSEGVQQNLVVRPDPDQPGHYLLIAGERRLRAAKMVGVIELPALVRDVDEKKARVIAALENDKRDNISAAEEAYLARNMLNACDGDRVEAAKQLGWSRSRLDARLLLLYAHDHVLQAVAQRKIKLGIAELLCGLPKTAQEKNLPVVIEKGYSVSELRLKIKSMAQQLSTAIFDKSECNGCPHNSSTQASLFDDGLSDGQCMGRSCFSEKTLAALTSKKADLEAQFNTIHLDVEVEPGSFLDLHASDVGDEQFAACKGCAHYGALLSSEPGLEGSVTESVCFDPLCHAGKVKQAKSNAEKAAQKQSSSDHGKSVTSTEKKKPKKDKTSVSLTPKKVRDLSVSFLRSEAASIIEKDPAARRAIMLYSLLHHIEKLSDKTGKTPAESLALFHEMDDSILDKYEEKATQIFIESFAGRFNDTASYENTAFTLLNITNHSLTGRFVLTPDFLKAHTKSGIEALMREAVNPDGQTFSEWWEGKHGSFKKLFAQKTDALIDTIMESGFDFSQWVPTCIISEIEKIKSPINKAGA